MRNERELAVRPPWGTASFFYGQVREKYDFSRK